MKQVLFFSAPWCTPCERFGPIVAKVAKEGGYAIEKINTDEDLTRALTYKVASIPVMVGLRDDRVVARLEGAHTENQLYDWLNSF